MRRADKEITDHGEIEQIIQAAQVCRLAMVDDGMPYVVPLNFGYGGGCLYFHCAGAGRKLAILQRNDQVCFLFDLDHQLVQGEQACQWGMRYKSVIGFGKAARVTEQEEKRLGLATIMAQYGATDSIFPDQALADITVFKVQIDTMTGKQSGY